LRLRYPPFTADDLFLLPFSFGASEEQSWGICFLSFVFYVTLGFGM
jgi:hypothetical protein